MPKARRPRCIGFRTSFSLSKRVCSRQKLNQSLVDVSAQDWSSTKAMANAAAKLYYNKRISATEIRSSLIRSFDAIRKLGNQRLSIQNYARECYSYWKNVSVEDFNSEY